MQKPQPQPRLSPLQEAQLDAIYDHLPPTPDQIARLRAVDEAGKNFERTVRLYCPPSETMIQAVHKIRDARSTANRAIAMEAIEAAHTGVADA